MQWQMRTKMNSIKPFMNISQDRFGPYLNSIVTASVDGFLKTISGRLVELDDHYIILEHRDGGRTTIARRAVRAISKAHVCGQRGD
jgi:hypothetical protein